MNKIANYGMNLLKENPVFGLYLGLCSALAISNNLNNAVGMGVAVIIVLTISNILVSALRKFTPEEIRIPVYIVIVATLVKSVELLMKAYAPALDAALGVFVPLIVVNCIILGRAEAFASKNGVFASMLDGLNMGFAYTLSLVAIAIIRQFLSSGGLSLSNPFSGATIFEFTLIPSDYIIPVFNQPIGAFLTFAFLAAGVAAIKNASEARAAKGEA